MLIGNIISGPLAEQLETVKEEKKNPLREKTIESIKASSVLFQGSRKKSVPQKFFTAFQQLYEAYQPAIRQLQEMEGFALPIDLAYRIHKSKKHHDGEPCFNGKYFVVMAELPSGQISNHYKLKHWDLFDIPEQEVSDVWDGHDPEIALNRILDFCTETKMLTDFEEEVLITLNSDAEYCHNYKSLSHYLECGKEDLIPVIERFKELGFLEYYRGLMNDEGEVAGSGWCRSKKGNDYIEEHEL